MDLLGSNLLEQAAGQTGWQNLFPGIRAIWTTPLNALCETLADCSAFGGCNSGIDWRYWNGGAYGYEGILTDQFGILAAAIDHYGR